MVCYTLKTDKEYAVSYTHLDVYKRQLWKRYEYMERGMGGIGYVFSTEEEALKDLYDMVLGEYEITRDVEEMDRREAEEARARAEEGR